MLPCTGESAPSTSEIMFVILLAIPLHKMNLTQIFQILEDLDDKFSRNLQGRQLLAKGVSNTKFCASGSVRFNSKGMLRTTSYKPLPNFFYRGPFL